MRNLKRNLIDIAIFILLLYIISTFVLTYIYDGGNPVKPLQTSFCWNENLLSDLGRAYYFNGKLNPFSFFYNSSLAFLGVSIFILYYIISDVLKNKKINKIIIITGALSGIGTMSIGWFPSDLFLKTHKIASLLSFYCYYFSVLLLIIFIDKKQYKLIFHLMLTLILLFISRIFLIYWAKNAGFNPDTLFRIKAISLKLIIFPQIIFSTIIMLYIRRTTPVLI